MKVYTVGWKGIKRNQKGLGTRHAKIGTQVTSFFRGDRNRGERLGNLNINIRLA
jgi:hypothetical protein